MSDLTRLRKNLQECEKRGKRHKAELATLREEIEAQAEEMTRAQEQAVKHLDGLLNFDRQQWEAIWRRVRAEEKRLLADPAAFLRFT